MTIYAIYYSDKEPYSDAWYGLLEDHFYLKKEDAELALADLNDITEAVSEDIFNQYVFYQHWDTYQDYLNSKKEYEIKTIEVK